MNAFGVHYQIHSRSFKSVVSKSIGWERHLYQVEVVLQSYALSNPGINYRHKKTHISIEIDTAIAKSTKLKFDFDF